MRDISRRLRRTSIRALGLAIPLWASPLQAQAVDPARLPGDGFGFQAALGWASISGDYGDLITSGIPAEGGVWYQSGHLRGGFNILVASYDVIEPFDSQSLSQVELAVQGIWRFTPRAPLQPYAGLRAGLIRFRPEGALFDPEPPGLDVPPGENEADERTGFIGGAVAGVEYWVSRRVGFMAAGEYRFFRTDELDVLILGATGIEQGSAAGFRLGVVWKP